MPRNDKTPATAGTNLDEASQLLDKADELDHRATQLEQRALELENRLGGPSKDATAKSTDITVVLDRSGSMEATRDDAIGSFNSFLDEQRSVEGEAAISLVQFDDQYELVYEGRPLADAPKLTDETFCPRGMTALLDAVGRTIVRTDGRLAKSKKIPQLVVFVILTDGRENASREFTRSQVFKMIREHEEKHGWRFIYLGANQDAIAEAAKLGVSGERAMYYDIDRMGSAQGILGKKISAYRRSSDTKDLSFTERERRSAKESE